MNTSRSASAPRSTVLVLASLDFLAGAATLADGSAAPEVRIGSKKFTESVVLGEVLAHLARDAGANVTHRRELGGTRILWNALRQGEIDAYAEYTGTIREEILVGEVSLGRIEDVRRNWPFLRDRRIDAYDGIDRRYLDPE